MVRISFLLAKKNGVSDVCISHFDDFVLPEEMSSNVFCNLILAGWENVWKVIRVLKEKQWLVPMKAMVKVIKYL